MRHRLALGFILVTVAMDSIGAGLIFPVLPDLMEEVTGLPVAQAVIWGGVLATAFSVMQFLCGPTIGNLSDRFGRKPILVSALVVMAFDYLLMATAQTIWLLVIGRVIAGITAATHTTAAAYIADIYPPDRRARGFGLIGAIFGLGFVAGPLIGGLLSVIDTRAPFWAAAILSATNAVFGLMVLPESLAHTNRRVFRWRRANPLGSFKAIGALPGVKRYLAVFGLYELAMFAYPAIWAFYGRVNFGFDATTIGYTLALFGICMALAQAFFVGPLIARFGEFRTVVIGMALDIVVLFAFGVTKSHVWIWVFTALAGLVAVVGPALQGLMSRVAPGDQQGELQGVTASVMALATIVSPLLMSSVFAYFTQADAVLYAPGAPFLLASAFMIVCLGIMMGTRSLTSNDGAPVS